MTRPRLFLIALLLFAASTAWSRIAGERPVSDPLYGFAPGGKWPAVVATDGDGFLTVWSDVRSWPDAIYAARVSANGEPIDRTGIRIALGSDPSVVFAGDSYAVFWLEYGSTQSTLHIARISREGRIIDGPRVVADGVPRIAFAAASNGRRIVIAWPERFFVLSAEGELLERDIRIQNDCHTPFCEGTPLVASNGSSFLMALPFQGQILALALDANGHRLSSGVKFDSDAVPIALTTDGNNYMVVDASTPVNATSQQVSASGVLLAHNDLGGRLATKPIALTWDGTDYVGLSRANFADAPRVTLRLTWSGFVLQLPPAGETVLNRGAVASNGRTLFAAWNGGASTSAAAILTERLDMSTLAATPPTVISFSATTQLNPSTAFSGINYAVVWNEGSRSWLRRFSLTGDPIDPLPVPLDTVVGRSSSAPRVTFDGKNYVAAALADTPTHSGRVHIRLTRLDPLTGQILSAFDGPDAFSDTTFDLRSDGTNVVMAWSWSGELRAAQIGMTNVVNQNTITSPQTEGFAPSLAWSGTQWLVSFNFSISLGPRFLKTTLGGGETPFEHHVDAVRLSPALAVLDPQPIEVGIQDVTFSDPFIDSHAASVGGDFIVAMTHVQSHTVLLRRVFADGTIAPDVQRLGAGAALDIVADHGRYAVAIATPLAPGFQQFVTYVDRNGVASSRDAFPLGFSVSTARHVQLAVGLDGLVAAYQRTAYEPLYGGVERVFLRSSSSEGRGRAAASQQR